MSTTSITPKTIAARIGVHLDPAAPAVDPTVKAKHLKKGQAVRPFVHGEPRGSERVVESVKRIGDGAQVSVTYSSSHPAVEVKAAYRFVLVTDTLGANRG